MVALNVVRDLLGAFIFAGAGWLLCLLFVRESARRRSARVALARLTARRVR